MDLDTIAAQRPGEGDIPYLCRELKRRTAEIKKRFPFFVFVLVAIVGLGGLGIWAELVKLAHSNEPEKLDGVFTAVAAFYPAVVGSASFQLLLIATGKLDRVITAFGILVLAFSFGAAVLLGIFHAQYPIACLVLAIVLVAFLNLALDRNKCRRSNIQNYSP